jgi:hypothetical protein
LHALIIRGIHRLWIDGLVAGAKGRFHLGRPGGVPSPNLGLGDRMALFYVGRSGFSLKLGLNLAGSLGFRTQS